MLPGSAASCDPNFALGAVLLTDLAGIAAPFFENVEAIELHHDQQVDAPSGTALDDRSGDAHARQQSPFAYPETTKQTLAGTRGGEHGGAVALTTVSRSPGLVAHHAVDGTLGGLGQTLTLRHDSTSRRIVSARRSTLRARSCTATSSCAGWNG